MFNTGFLNSNLLEKMEHKMKPGDYLFVHKTKESRFLERTT